MKFWILSIAVLSLSFAACKPKSKEDIDREVDEIIKKAQDDVQNTTKAFEAGGQPGKIKVSGIVVKKDGTSFQLDERLKVEQTGGKAKGGGEVAPVSDQQKATLSDVVDKIDFTSESASKNYINLGCEKLSAEDTQDLKEIEAKETTESLLQLSAKKIFICGQGPKLRSTTLLKAEEMILRNVNISWTAVVAGLSLTTMKLRLEGTNSIETKGVDMAMAVLTPASLDLVVTNEIHGEGKLTLRSVGSNVVEEKKDTKKDANKDANKNEKKDAKK